VGFVATTWYTIIIAAIAAYFDTRRWWNQKSFQLPVTSNQESESDSSDQPHLEPFAKKLLDSLCDLQIITGMAMVVAGLAQMPEIPYYHE
jgi:hypothetical protein